MPIVNDTKDDIGYDTDPPHYVARSLSMAAVGAAGAAMVIYAVLGGNVALSVAGMALLVIGSVGLDRTLRQRRELLSPRIVGRSVPLAPDDRAGQPRQARAGAPRVLAEEGGCQFEIPAWSVVPEPTVFPPGAVFRFCVPPSGAVFATVEISSPMCTVSYADGRPDESKELVQPTLITIARPSTGGPHEVKVS